MGKSWYAIKELGGDMKKIFMKNGQNKWWDGYNNEENVLIDELPLEASDWNLNYMKKWLDVLPC